MSVFYKYTNNLKSKKIEDGSVYNHIIPYIIIYKTIMLISFSGMTIYYYI